MTNEYDQAINESIRTRCAVCGRITQDYQEIICDECNGL